ncbi:hypothetical protein CBS101457_000130 [Exobasidium rhododendri]|nr:hypothetical protein CBS101457_000130 [Exobasidium rhododendri]
MSIDESIIVAKKIASVTGKKEDHIRNFFLRTQLEEQTAWKILTADLEECKRYAAEMGLDYHNPNRLDASVPESKIIETWPWMNGLVEDQKKMVIDKMMRITGRSKEWCYDILRQSEAENGLGLYLLNAEDAAAKAKVRSLMAAKRRTY